MKKYIIVSVISIAGLLTCLAWSKSSQSSKQTINIDLKTSSYPVKSMIGFLLSFNDDTPSQKLIDDVSPRSWRVGHGLPKRARYSSLKAIRNNTLPPIVLVSDFYKYPVERPKTWTPPNQNPKDYLQVIDTLYSRYGNNVIYDLWNEPSSFGTWRGSESDFFATFKLAHDKIRSLPGGSNALISGPSIDRFDKAYIGRFLAYCAQNNIKLDVLSWHDVRNGDKLIQLKSDLQWVKKNWVDKYPSLGIKKIQINEIIGKQDQYSPLVPLMYFKGLEDGGADAACKACWKNSKGISNCANNSMDGLIDENDKPRSIWWAYKFYNESTKKRLNSSSSSEDLISFAYLAPDSNNEIRVLLANYKNDINSVAINLPQLKTLDSFKNKSNVVVEYYQIPDTEEDPLGGPKLLSTKTVSIASSTSPSISIPNLESNQVYLVKIK
jgi:xylan 1,4-beta-xylosidase